MLMPFLILVNILVILGCATKPHRVGGLNYTHSLLIILQAVKSKIKMSVDLVPSDGRVPGSQKASSLCPNIIE